MSALTILDRVNDGDYEGLHPVEYAIRPSPEKLAEIERIMGGVRKKVRENAASSRKALDDEIYAAMGTHIDDYPAIAKEHKKFLDRNRNGKDNYAMRLDEDAIRSILEGDGIFKNQFETLTSNGAFHPHMRAYVSKQNFGTPYKESSGLFGSFDPQQKALIDSEKYGYAKNTSSAKAARGYGSFVVNFNPENMEHRTTISFKDSLGSRFRPALLDEPETWPALIGDENSIHRQYTRDVPPSENGTWALDVFGNSHADEGNDGYNELQYHGPLDVGDIDKITLPKNEFFVDSKHTKIRSYTADDIPEKWKDVADRNNFSIVDDEGNILYAPNSGH